MQESLVRTNRLIKQFQNSMAIPVSDSPGPLRVGVDLGTANVVVAVTDKNGMPVAGALQQASVVRDGLVVNYSGAVAIVNRLVTHLRSNVREELRYAAVAVPPGTGHRDAQAIRHVAEAADLTVTNIVDEPVAAMQTLGVDDAVVVDVGGGTTGISVLEQGNVVYSVDEPTGGTHFTLVISGHYNIPFGEAETMKTTLEKQPELFPVIRPVIEKVAAIIKSHIRYKPVSQLYLVGGAVSFYGFAGVIQEWLDVPVLMPEEPLLITPFGIALSCRFPGEVE